MQSRGQSGGGGKALGGGGWLLMSTMAVESYDHELSHPCSAGSEQVEFSPIRQTLLAAGAGGRANVFLASVVWSILTTHPFRDAGSTVPTPNVVTSNVCALITFLLYINLLRG